LITEPHPDLDRSIVPRFATVADDARVTRTAVLGPGRALSVVDAQPGTRVLLMGGKPYGETPEFNGPYVD
jgi:redox-sensitive bicupin YhaK (pirin superfamily)